MTQRIVQQHMNDFDAARAFGVVSRFSPARQNELRADTKLGGKGVEYVTANMARWVALFRAGPSMQGHRVPSSTTESEASQARGRQSGVRAEAPQAGRSSSVPVVPSVETGDGARAGNASNQGRSAAQSVPMTSAHRAPTDDSRSQPARPVRDESEVLYDHIKHSQNDVDLTMPFSSPDLETETLKQDMKKPPFRLPKWPLSHSERISELEEQLPFYANTNQAKNIIAAIKYHSQYSGEDMVSSEIITFVDGKRIDEANLDANEGTTWFEVRKMCPHGKL